MIEIVFLKKHNATAMLLFLNARNIYLTVAALDSVDASKMLM